MLLILALLAMLAQPSDPPQAPSTKTPVWKFVAMDGPIFIFYVPADRASDKQIYAEIVHYIFSRIGDKGPFQADFFDDESKTPKSREYNDDNRAHQRARFKYNPVNGKKQFLWIRPEDAANPFGRRIATEDTLPLDGGDAKGKDKGKDGQ